MSRVAKSPINLPKGVEITESDSEIIVKNGNKSLSLKAHALVSTQVNDGVLTIVPKNDQDKDSWMLAGTYRALLNNMVQGVSAGFEKKLQLVGVGYRAQVQGSKINLSLGFSHPVIYELPEGITAETPSQTEIVLKGIDKQLLGQVAANIRGFRPPEPYKGKGVRYADERIIRKEAKKK